jgi:hypothetical protein
MGSKSLNFPPFSWDRYHGELERRHQANQFAKI